MNPHELKIRLKLLEIIFSRKTILQHVKQKTMEKWVRGDSVPRETSLQKLCGALGMTAADLYSPIDQFVSILCEKGDHGYTPEQLQKEIERFSQDNNGREIRPPNPFQETMRLFGKEALQKIYSSYAGLYYAYMYWQNNDPEKENRVLAVALEIHDYNEASNTIRCRLASDNEQKRKIGDLHWDFNGIFIFTHKKVYWIFESYTIIEPEIVIISTETPKVESKLLHGIISAGTPSITRGHVSNSSIPGAARIIMEKVTPGSDDIPELGWRDPEEFTGSENGESILSCINNQIDDPKKILLTRFSE